MNVSTNTCYIAWFIGGLTICVECLILDGAYRMEYTRRLKNKVSSAFGDRGPCRPKASLPIMPNQTGPPLARPGLGPFELGLGRDAL